MICELSRQNLVVSRLALLILCCPCATSHAAVLVAVCVTGSQILKCCHLLTAHAGLEAVIMPSRQHSRRAGATWAKPTRRIANIDHY